MYPLGKTNQYLWRLSLIFIISRVNCQGASGGGGGVEGEWWLWVGLWCPCTITNGIAQ